MKVAVLLLVVLAHVPALIKFLAFARADLSAGTLAVFGLTAGLLTWRAWYGRDRRVVGSQTFAAVLALTAAVTLLVGALLDLPESGIAALVTTLAAGAWANGGRHLFSRMLPALLVLTLLVPFSWEPMQQAVEQVHEATAAVSSRVLDVVRVVHRRAGQQIECPSRIYSLAEVGSRGWSVVILFALTYLGFQALGRPAWHLAILLVVAAGAALLMNVARVVTVIYLTNQLNWEPTQGIWLTGVDCGWLIVALALVVGVDQFLVFLLSPVEPVEFEPFPPPPAPLVMPSVPTPGIRTWLASWPVGAVFALMGLGPLALGWNPSSGTEIAERMAAPGPDRFPPVEGHWESVAFTIEQHPRRWIWTFRNGPRHATLTVEGSTRLWSDATRRYRAEGWNVCDVAHYQEEAGEPYTLASLERVPLRFALLYYGTVGDAVNTLPGPESTRLSGLSRLVAARQSRGRQAQVQLFLQRHHPWSAAEREEGRTFFLKCRTWVGLQIGLNTDDK